MFYVAALFIGGAIQMTRAADSTADISAPEIMRLAQAKYAALTSYQDEGTTVATLGQTVVSSFIFTVKAGRTNLYQVAWRQDGNPLSGGGVVWSAGDGDFMWMGNGTQPKKFKDLGVALTSAAGVSGGAAASVPGIFFKTGWANQLQANMATAARLGDEKIETVDCFVLSHGAAGRTNTLWIGKQDFLIHQIMNFTSGANVRKVLEARAQSNPQIRAMLDAPGSQVGQDVTAVETHRNIITNPPLAKGDFNFQVPTGTGP